MPSSMYSISSGVRSGYMGAMLLHPYFSTVCAMTSSAMWAKNTGDSIPPCLMPLTIFTFDDPHGVWRRPTVPRSSPLQQFNSAPRPSCCSNRSRSFARFKLSNAFSRSSLKTIKGAPHSLDSSKMRIIANKKSEVCLPLPEHWA